MYVSKKVKKVCKRNLILIFTSATAYNASKWWTEDLTNMKPYLETEYLIMNDNKFETGSSKLHIQFRFST